MKKTNNEAIIYCRTNSNDNNLIKKQELSCQKMAKEKGYQILETIIDNHSMNIKIEKLNNLITKNKINAIFVHSKDRLTRNTSNCISIQKLLDDNNIKLFSVI